MGLIRDDNNDNQTPATPVLMSQTNCYEEYHLDTTLCNINITPPSSHLLQPLCHVELNETSFCLFVMFPAAGLSLLESPPYLHNKACSNICRQQQKITKKIIFSLKACLMLLNYKVSVLESSPFILLYRNLQVENWSKPTVCVSLSVGG